MPAKITIDDEVSKVIRGLRRELKDSEKRMLEGAKIIQEEIKTSFENKASPLGEGWNPPSETTKDLGFKRQLEKTGKLKRSIEKGTRIQNGFQFTSKLPYAAAQHFGNPNNKIFGKKKAPIPARPFIPVDTKNEVYKKTIENVIKAMDKRLQKVIDEETKR